MSAAWMWIQVVYGAAAVAAIAAELLHQVRTWSREELHPWL